ncbi:hypothetical protein [Enterococcus gallinarum]|uniref:hypothetical protein n=1 Tax=Enterococcus gallinarum TaxID=1353 RepID=UPI0018A940B0|nr:hypothetical protein [Enterococcus gallinarum]
MKLADNVQGVQDGKYSPPRVARKQSKVKPLQEYWCVTERLKTPFKAVCVKVGNNAAIVSFGSERAVVRLRDMKKVE